MMNFNSYFILSVIIPLTAIAVSTTTSATTIGVSYSTRTPTRSSVIQVPPANRIAETFVSMNIKAVRLLDSSPAMIYAFAYTNVSLLLCIPNHLVLDLASNRSIATHWVKTHVLQFHRVAKISKISVGEDMISYSPRYLLRAMKNVHQSLTDLRIYGVCVTTTFNFADMIPSSPSMKVITPILGFLSETESSLMINLCPYAIFDSNCSVALGISISDQTPPKLGDNLPLGRFRKLLDIMIELVLSSMWNTGHRDIPVVVFTGWSSHTEVEERWRHWELLLRSMISAPPLLQENALEQVYIYEVEVGERYKGWKHNNLSYGTEQEQPGNFLVCLHVLVNIYELIVEILIDWAGRAKLYAQDSVLVKCGVSALALSFLVLCYDRRLINCYRDFIRLKRRASTLLRQLEQIDNQRDEILTATLNVVNNIIALPGGAPHVIGFIHQLAGLRNLRETNPDQQHGLYLRTTATCGFLRLIMQHGLSATIYLIEVSTNFIEVFTAPAVQEYEEDLEALTQHCGVYPQILAQLLEAQQA